MVMSAKKTSIFITSILLIALLSACGTESKPTETSTEPKPTETSTDLETEEAPNQENISAKFQPTVEISEEGEATIINYKVVNVSGAEQKLTFTDGLQVDFIIYDEAGEIVKQLSKESSSSQVIDELSLAENDLLEKEFTITDLYNGEFKIEVFLTANEEDTKVASDLIIKNSTYSKAIGELVGLMDPHTVEITVDGEAAAFQLTDMAQQQISSLQDEAQVSFIYKVENEQKTIEEFLIN